MNITNGQKIADSSHQTDAVLKILKDVTRKYNVGKKEINVSFDALHGVQPNQEDIIKLIQKRNPSVRKDRIIKVSREINLKSRAIQKDNTDYDSKSALSIIRDETNDELVKSIINIKKLYESGTEDIVTMAANKSGASYFLAAQSRVRQDLNRPAGSKRISKKVGESTNYNNDARAVEHFLFQQFIEKTASIDGHGKIERPFMCISVHGCAKFKNGSDIFIGNGVKRGKMPCDPVIARWVKSEIDKQIRKRRMVNSKKEYLRVHVSTEGSRLSGSTAMIERRYGSTNIFGFGDLFQAVQLELSPLCRKKYQKEIALAISEIAITFSKEFSTRDKYLDYKKSNSTPVDKAREKGCLYFNAIGCARHSNNTLKMNSDFRRWLDVRKGDSVNVHTVDDSKISTKPLLTLKISNAHYTEKKAPFPLFDREINKPVIICKD